MTNWEETKCFSFQKIAVWVGGDYVGGHILWWGQLRDGGELRGRGRITAYNIEHFVQMCNWRRTGEDKEDGYSLQVWIIWEISSSSKLRHLSHVLVWAWSCSVFSYSHLDVDLFVTLLLHVWRTPPPSGNMLVGEDTHIIGKDLSLSKKIASSKLRIECIFFVWFVFFSQFPTYSLISQSIWKRKLPKLINLNWTRTNWPKELANLLSEKKTAKTFLIVKHKLRVR